MRNSGITLACVAMVASLVVPPLVPVVEASGCQATVRASQMTDEVHDQYVDKVFAVDIDTRESCAKVYVDLVTTERLFNGEEITSTVRGYRKVSTHTTYKVKHRIARDSRLVNWEFKVARCVVCGME